MSQLKLTYDVLTDSRNKLSQRDFTKAMSRLNITTAVKRIKDKTVRGVVLTWKLDNNIREELIKNHFEETDLNLLKQA
jgi:stalled ribosome rescue protein Dom34